MQQADKVSEEDMYLLHEIMLRCQWNAKCGQADNNEKADMQQENQAQ